MFTLIFILVVYKIFIKFIYSLIKQYINGVICIRKPKLTNREDKVENVSANKKNAVVVKPHKKIKVERSQTQALSQLAGGMTKLIESQAKRHKEQMEFDKERDQEFLEFKKSRSGKKSEA